MAHLDRLPGSRRVRLLFACSFEKGGVWEQSWLAHCYSLAITTATSAVLTLLDDPRDRLARAEKRITSGTSPSPRPPASTSSLCVMMHLPSRQSLLTGVIHSPPSTSSTSSQGRLATRMTMSKMRMSSDRTAAWTTPAPLSMSYEPVRRLISFKTR